MGNEKCQEEWERKMGWVEMKMKDINGGVDCEVQWGGNMDDHKMIWGEELGDDKMVMGSYNVRCRE